MDDGSLIRLEVTVDRDRASPGATEPVALFEEQRCRFYERLHSFADNDGPARFGSMEEFGSTAAPAAALATTLGGGGGEGGSVSFSKVDSYPLVRKNSMRAAS